MRTANKISPMTSYYLRRLIQDNYTQLVRETENPESLVSVDQDSRLIDRDRLQAINSPAVLEKLVALHQSLVATGQEDSPQIQSVEFQIFNMLGFEQTSMLPAHASSSPTLIKFSPQKCADLLNQLYGLRKKCDSLISPKVTYNYLKKSCPKDDWSQDEEVVRLVSLADEDKRELMTNNRLELYEQWTDSFLQQCEITLPQLAMEAEQRPARNSNEDQTGTLDWMELRNSCSVAIFISNTPAPRRIRDILKTLNVLYQKSSALIGLDRSRDFLLMSRPNHEWCQLFRISEAGSVSFRGNVRELITNTRLTTFGEWMDTFWELCESLLPHLEQASGGPIQTP